MAAGCMQLNGSRADIPFRLLDWDSICASKIGVDALPTPPVPSLVALQACRILCACTSRCQHSSILPHTQFCTKWWRAVESKRSLSVRGHTRRPGFRGVQQGQRKFDKYDALVRAHDSQENPTPSSAARTRVRIEKQANSCSRCRGASAGISTPKKRQEDPAACSGICSGMCSKRIVAQWTSAQCVRRESAHES